MGVCVWVCVCGGGAGGNQPFILTEQRVDCRGGTRRSQRDGTNQVVTTHRRGKGSNLSGRRKTHIKGEVLNFH